MKIKFIILIGFIFSASLIFAQNDIIDNNYKFKISLSSAWQTPKSEETDKKDAISYSTKSSDGKLSMMILAFKLNSIKNLADLIYTIEKDLTLNLPKRTSEYTDYDFGYYDGRSAVYQNAEFVETVYFFRTKYADLPSNYAYVIRFITTTAFYNSSMESEIKNISGTFKVTE